ncbi:hypothetical protein FH589_01850 (plasmid) [Leptospira interrogans]|nr:hypothetical protein [Leptospira interrogans]ULG82598.1 hypothetical protein FH595_19460 [Leptospira interrogans]UML67429.1 hypothetical protein FH589_01850 [Leptospira interrogans]UML82969.1 hypothetical protein FH587_03640 [Leptospira interrogans]UML83020.1 hypothetical protein FH587_03505 [Leptospira interrogans]
MTHQEWYFLSGKWGAAGYPFIEEEKGFQIAAYDYSEGCKYCGIGWKQKGKFIFEKKPKSKNIQFLSPYWTRALFVRGSVKTVFEKKNISGIEFLSVYLKNGKEIENLYQLYVTTILSPGLIPGDLNMELCENKIKDDKLKKELIAKEIYYMGPWCGKIKYNYSQGDKRALFKKEIFEHQPDFVLTNEWFGSGAGADRQILVSQKVKQIIEQNHWIGPIKGANLFPIQVQ